MTTDIKRKDAAFLLQEIALLVAKIEAGDFQTDYANTTPIDVATGLRTLLASRGVAIPEKCYGEAHSNAYIDNCSVCMPHWGWIAQEIKVK